MQTITTPNDPSSEIKITAPNYSELTHLRPIILNALQTINETYIDNHNIPCFMLPSSGKEITLTPVFYHAAFEAYKDKQVSYTPSAEVQVPRANGFGRLDLALINKKYIELCELKGARVKLHGPASNVIKKIESKLNSAKEQLNSINVKKLAKETALRLEKTAIVSLNLMTPEETTEYKNRFALEQLLSKVKESYPYALRASLLYKLRHQINRTSSKDKGEYTVGMLVIALRV
ncbi:MULTISPECIES: hypothetical protein [Pseudoalteromonas]|uniref:Uncharacterized protein n=1 Tax=Pseudoalteromonas maricaloris TaxID=184924 RepID=A0A8I2H445_9GAMM|nr:MULTISPECIES: hypothetical protein [Pseudoalteromonas]NLR22766.1 hypothetical protein [Pseudoalteromonas maricaloris]WMO16227.1 hypothetical protein NI376_23720 [Pseudoalteromonas piscicida]WOX31053.1 hypothetical protein R5H13_24610 [Pseudoalteromonas maricaloris]